MTLGLDRAADHPVLHIPVPALGSRHVGDQIVRARVEMSPSPLAASVADLDSNPSANMARAA